MFQYSEIDTRNFAENRDTSLEICEAILEFSYKNDKSAARIWDSPTEQEQESIIIMAFSLTDEGELHWGQETIKRP